MSTAEELMREVQALRRITEQRRIEKEAAEARMAAAKGGPEAAEAQAEVYRCEIKMFEAQAAMYRREREAAEARVEVLQQRHAPSRFLDYVRSIDKHIHGTLRVRSVAAPYTSSSAAARRMEGMFYPRTFRPWAAFAAVHAQTWETWTTTFADRGLFPPTGDVACWGREMSPDVADEQDLRPFVRTAMEKPASVIVTKYLDLTSHPTISGVQFRNHASGVLADEEGLEIEEMHHLGPPEAQQPLPSTGKAVGIPDRWAFAKHRDGKDKRILLGEYKAAHKLPGEKLRRVLSTHPGEDFFVRAMAEAKNSKDKTGARAAAASSGPSAAGSAAAREPSDTSLVAQVLCEVYHYMISSGLEFGYVSSGDGLVFLRVLENDPRTLYYFWNVFPVNPHPDPAAGRPPEQTALAYMASLCKWALETRPRRASWTDACEDVVRRWPEPYVFPTLSFPSSPGTDGGDATAAAADEDYAGVFRRIVIREPTLPYCTQACLRGLCDGLPLDDKCPNAGLHRAAHAADNGAAPGHALTADAVRARVVAQLAAHLEQDCLCLDEDKCYGRFGALFKITVTDYGYTFVAKGVQAAHARLLQHELRVYERLRAQQGRLVPVCLGLVTLQRAFPLHSCAAVAHMLLLSYAGPAMNTAAGQAAAEAAEAAGVNMEKEGERTERDLASATGLWNEDVRAPNMAWNEEVGRVLHFDFDQAVFLREAEAEEAEAQEVHEKAYDDGDVDGRPAKRARTET